MLASSIISKPSFTQAPALPRPSPSSRNHCLFCTRFSSSVTGSTDSPGERPLHGATSRQNWVADWVSNNDNGVRSLLIFVGGLSLLAVILKRTISGVAPVVDASSSQSRADILTIVLAVTNILAGLVWLSIRRNTFPR